MAAAVSLPALLANIDPAVALELERLRAENAKLKARKVRPFSCKPGEKGGLSVYGLGRFPVTLYKSQWATLFENADKIKAALVFYAAQLKDDKDDSK